MKKALLITPKSQSVPHVLDVDYIGVDAGSLLILKEKLPLRFAIGDFDSMDEKSFEELQSKTKIFKHPVEKDETDSELSIRLCDEMGYDVIILWGGLSGRLDHTLSNIQLLLYRDPKVILMDEKQKVRLFPKGEYVISNEYKHLSFFAVESSIISAQGVYYPMDHQRVLPSDMFMVSNSFVDKKAVITIHSGKILCIESNYQ